ncbi:SsrA-binding protein SmpB [Candidatus Dojkabacteria bacterium]|nr:SsrA-binding protein SmpB [Candidatus Dojkabacteria bacterium]
MKEKKKKTKSYIFAVNKKARHEYEILENIEMGIVLKGAEVKAIRAGGASLKDSFVRIDENECWLWNCHISQWKYSSDPGYNPTRKRKLLAFREEIDTLSGKVNQKNLTLIPLKLYLKRGKIKVDVGLCRGMKIYDKRAKDKERTLKNELHKEKRKYVI